MNKVPPPALLAQTLQELAPHADRDHFVYVWQRFENGRVAGSGIQVEHVTDVGGGEFEVLLSEDGMAVGRTRFRDTGSAVLLLREDDMSRGLRLSYEPPLPQLTAPLLSGEQHASASVSMSRLADGQVLGVFPTQQLLRAAAGPNVRTAFGAFKQSVIMQVTRTLQLPDAPTELKTETVLVSGIGEIRSVGGTAEDLFLRRELACAIIGGRRVGDCTNLNQRRDQGGPRSSDVR